MFLGSSWHTLKQNEAASQRHALLRPYSSFRSYKSSPYSGAIFRFWEIQIAVGRYDMRALWLESAGGMAASTTGNLQAEAQVGEGE